MKKIAIVYIIVSLFVGVIPALTLAQSAPEVGDSTSSTDVIAPPTGDSTSSADVTPPSTGGSDSSAGEAPVTTSNVSTSGSRSGGFFSIVSTAKCPLITTDLKLGNANSIEEVTALQSFLSRVEGIVVPVTGQFDLITENAVKSFQKKYDADILTPWGASEPSGFVYITTRKKLNQLACSLTLARTAEEQAVIDSYKNKASAANIIGSNGSNSNGQGTVGNGSNVGPVGINALDAANAAAVGNLNIVQKFWNFLKSIF